jgi:hypothetical protein
MRIFKLTEKQFEDLKDILTSANPELANNPEFFEECESDPELHFDTKEYIDDRIGLCNALEIDFWLTAAAFAPPYDIKRLKAKYAGQSLKEFEEKHKRPTGPEFIKEIIKSYENGGF